MFERFTEESRHVVVGAQEEAKRLGHHQIATEHVLVALTADPQTLAGQFLAERGITLDASRQAVEDVAGRGEPISNLPFTPQAVTALRQSDEQARRHHFDAIGPEHILISLVHTGGDHLAPVLEKLGTSLDQVREQVDEMAGPPPGRVSRRLWGRRK